MWADTNTLSYGYKRFNERANWFFSTSVELFDLFKLKKNSVSAFRRSQKIGQRFSCTWRLSQIFQRFATFWKVMNPDLNKNLDKCFFSISENRAGVPLHTASCRNFFSVSGCFIIQKNSGNSQLASLWFVDWRIQAKINNFDEPFCNFFPCSMFCKKFMYTGTSPVWTYAELF